VVAALPNIGVEKNGVPFSVSNYKADVYEAWQLWSERDVVKCICFSFSILQSRFQITQVQSHHCPTVGQNLQIFALQMLRIQI